MIVVWINMLTTHLIEKVIEQCINSLLSNGQMNVMVHVQGSVSFRMRTCRKKICISIHWEPEIENLTYVGKFTQLTCLHSYVLHSDSEHGGLTLSLL